MQAPKKKAKYEITIDNFNGVDMRNAPSKVNPTRSPNAPNLIRMNPGSNRKRRGYETLLTFTVGDTAEPINGFHSLKTSATTNLIHAGIHIYKITESNGAYSSTSVYSTANDHFSMSRQVGNKLFIADGANLLVYDGTTMKLASDGAYIPTTFIAKTYQGGGTRYEPINLITPWRAERFTGDSTNKTFQLGATNIDADTVIIKALNSSGGFDTLTEGTDFTVNRTNGTFTLNTARATPVTGADNLYVTYAKTVSGYQDKIFKCDICTLYGMNGQRDRMFVSGNPDFPNYDWYCKSNDPTMWGDTWYSVIGQGDSSIVGYSFVGDYMVIHKDYSANDANAILRKGKYDSTNGYTFVTAGSYSAVGALAKHSFVQFENEPLYLSVEKNIQAITPSDVFGERSSEERSYYISTEIAKESNLENAYACYYDGFYMLAVSNKVYILDSTQSVLERNKPYSTRQYECYIFTNINARVIGVIDGRLWFGTSDGKVKRFFNTDKVGSFTDDGVTTQVTKVIDGVNVTTTESYPCYWETCEIYGTQEELKKTFKHLAVCLNAYPHTGCRIWANIDGIWEVMFDYDASANYLDFSDIDFSDFSFRTDNTPTLVGGKFKVKKVLHLQLRFENSRPQPFSVLWAKLKYTLGGEYIK
jgi:hypothetical protein